MKENSDPASILLPEGILDYFALVDVHKSEKDYHLFLDELANPPAPSGYHSKGFSAQAVIQDFPLRGKPVFLHIRRRKWLNIKTQEVVTSTFDLAHLGTQISQEFAAFLKEDYRKDNNKHSNHW